MPGKTVNVGEGGERSDKAYKDFKDRGCCTDCVCVLILALAVGGVFGILGVSISKEPELLDKLRYPSDSYDQWCGKPGTPVEDLPKALFPVLDKDVTEHFTDNDYDSFVDMVRPSANSA